MSVIVYFSDIRDAFLRANSVLWDNKNRSLLSVLEQIEGWKQVHNAKIFGGPYDIDKNGNSPATSYQRAIGLEFETKEDFVLFMFKWS